MPRPFKVQLVADHHQFHVRDGERFIDISDAWTVKAVENLLAVAEHVVGVGTVSDAKVSVTIEVLDSEPALELDRVDHATEASLQIVSGTLAVLGCTEDYAKAKRLELANGWWRLRTLQAGLGRARESARILLWPDSADRPAKVLERWTPPQAKPKKPATKKAKNAKQAAALARSGQTDLAVEALTALADAGDAAASASLAEIHAFRGEWAAFVPRAEALLVNPTAVYAGNVFTDLSKLCRRAARELGTPEIIERIASRVPERYSSMRDATLLKDAVVPSEQVEAATPDQTARFRQAIADARAGKRFEDRPMERARHEVALAIMFRQEDALLELWKATPEAFSFDHAIGVARWLGHRDQLDQAWAVVRQKLVAWLPADACQVAPCVLLRDATLSKLMTAARCAEVLSTPRGPEAQT